MTPSDDSGEPRLSTPRSALFVPADAPTRHAPAFAAGADAVILDLEDAVAPDAKDRARAEVGGSEVLRARDGRSLAYVRVNSPLTPAGEADLEVAAGWGVDALMVPKSEPRAIEVAAAAGLPLIALIETAAGIFAAAETAAHPAVAIVMVGPVDLAADLGVEESHGGDELSVARQTLVLAAAAAGKPGPLDGPCVAVRDEAALAAEIARAKRLGFAGKTCIHPAQVAAVTAGFTPSDEEVDWAGRVIEAFEAAGGGVGVLDGRMIDPPVITRARQILANEERNDER